MHASYAHIYAYTYVHIYEHAHKRIYIHMHMHIRMHIHIRLPTHLQIYPIANTHYIREERKFVALNSRQWEPAGGIHEEFWETALLYQEVMAGWLKPIMRIRQVFLVFTHPPLLSIHLIFSNRYFSFCSIFIFIWQCRTSKLLPLAKRFCIEQHRHSPT